MVAAWGESSDEESYDEDEDEQALMKIGESDEESEVSIIHLKDKIKFLSKEKLSELLLDFIDESELINKEKQQLSKDCVILKVKCKNLELRVSETVSENTTLKNQVHTFEANVLELKSENLKLKLGTSKKTIDCTQLTLEENLGKLKDELYRKNEQVRVLKEDLGKVKHELDKTRKWNRSSDALSWLLEHHSSNRRGFGFGNQLPKWDPKSKYLTLSDNKICTHRGKTGHYKSECNAKERASQKNKILFKGRIGYQGKRVNNIYIIDLSTLSENELTCLSVLDSDPFLWHKRLGHASLSQLNKLVSKNLVIGLPNIKFKEDKVCEACARGKRVGSSFKCKKVVTTTRTMELVHMDLCGPMRTLSRGGKRYVMVLIDDYSRFTWTLYLTSKGEAFDMFTSFVRKTQKQLGNQLASIRYDHGTEFQNAKFAEFCDVHGIDPNFSGPITPQQNGVVEKKNRTLENMARTMLLSSKLPHNFWAEAIYIACYIINRCITRPLVEKTPYELLKERKPNISHLKAFRCKCFVHNNGNDSLESVHVVFDETNILFERQEQDDEAIRLVKHLNETTTQAEASLEEGIGDRTCSSIPDNITRGNRTKQFSNFSGTGT
ncbi:uncharacterized protein [Nicotiana tomentosiformis]|uniref:uncharacterized protein n=1 Tax=Nicotiana tomentosiformis TaxID=4098 RepID=UPI00388C7392